MSSASVTMGAGTFANWSSLILAFSRLNAFFPLKHINGISVENNGDQRLKGKVTFYVLIMFQKHISHMSIKSHPLNDAMESFEKLVGGVLDVQ